MIRNTTVNTSYLEGGQADGSPQADAQAHPLVAKTLALVPVLQQAGTHRLFGFGPLLLLHLGPLHWSQRHLDKQDQQTLVWVYLRLKKNLEM